jgi:hypothetical protein
MIKAKAPFVWVRYWQTKRVHLVEELSHAICGVSWVAGEAIDAADESEICKTCLKIARNRGLIEEVPEHTKPAQDPIKKQMHEYECRAKNAEDEVAEMRAKVERSKKREADTYAMFERENKKRVEAVRKVDDVEKENRRLKNSDRAVLDTIAKIDEEHEEQVAGLREQIMMIEKAHDAMCEATNGHNLKNIKTIMGSFKPRDLEGSYIDSVHIKTTPIIEYIPTEEIVDALIDELGRIECEVCNNLSSNKGWIPSILIQVESDVEYAYETPKVGKHDMRWWNQCRIRKDTIESLRGSK